MEILKQLVPPGTVEQFTLKGYNSVSFPSWMMDVTTYLPHLVEITLWIGRMDSIRKIDQELYGGIRAFPQLDGLQLSEMKSLEDWNSSSYSSPSPSPSPSDEDGSNELMFPHPQWFSNSKLPQVKIQIMLIHR